MSDLNPFNLPLDARLRNVAGALEGNGMKPLSEIVWQAVEAIERRDAVIQKADHEPWCGPGRCSCFLSRYDAAKEGL